MEKKELSYLIFILLCKRNRRQQIIFKWNASQPVKGDTPVEILTLFINTILHESIKVVMTHNAISFWDGKLQIPYAWLTAEESNQVKQLYIKHKSIFKHREKYEANCFKFSQCILKGDIYPLKHRRELVRDFATICTHILKKNNQGRWLLIQCCQQMMVSRKKTDRFIYELHNQLQLNGNVRNIPVIL